MAGDIARPSLALVRLLHAISTLTDPEPSGACTGADTLSRRLAISRPVCDTECNHDGDCETLGGMGTREQIMGTQGRLKHLERLR
jgi:hypothetical protein